MRKVFLVDNGSLRPSSTLNLRRVAAALTTRTSVEVEPVSLLHSNKVPAADLGGEAAKTFGPTATRWAKHGVDDIIILPFFFGPSRALTDYVPERVRTLQENCPDVRVRVARPLMDLHGTTDLRLAQILKDGVLAATGEDRPAVALVDHGSPIPEVTAVRNVLAGQLSVLLAGQVSRVTGASMERREGDAYRFNEPLLERLLDRPGFRDQHVVVSMLFLSPGRHAGEDGDVATICNDAQARNPRLRTTMTRLAGEHDTIVDILADRLHETVNDGPILLEQRPELTRAIAGEQRFPGVQ
ncbi:CbiX/SirB N-terminal domain-containing protein [Aquisalimonas sp.]|uniref:sirohydrochlorin chelatase n=1 Tax=Aquisalimonas sp. TaxID=1872621 RepID=UPI0025B895BD|nr:CbiX/SirB N-terminal domain-containing protein [Aquisalimonas sp.]